MSEILIQTKKPTNLKPDSWYKGYLEINNSYLLEHPEEQIPLITIKEIKEFDVIAEKNQSHNCSSGFLQFEEKKKLETPQKYYCKFCGKEVNPNEENCEECSTRLEKEDKEHLELEKFIDTLLDKEKKS